MPPKVQKSKAAKMLAAMSSSKGKGKKKKWAKVAKREKKNNAVIFDEALFKKMMEETPRKLRVITVSTVSEQFKITASLARRAIKELVKAGSIKLVLNHSSFGIYTKA